MIFITKYYVVIEIMWSSLMLSVKKSMKLYLQRFVLENNIRNINNYYFQVVKL